MIFKSLEKKILIRFYFLKFLNRETALKQREHCNRIREETKKLLIIYNQLMNVVKNQLAAWEARALTEEQKKQEEENTIKSLEEFD